MKLLSGTKKKQRQANALQRLENQLKSGVKTYGNYISGGKTSLTESDIKRINSEITILKSRRRV